MGYKTARTSHSNEQSKVSAPTSEPVGYDPLPAQTAQGNEARCRRETGGPAPWASVFCDESVAVVGPDLVTFGMDQG